MANPKVYQIANLESRLTSVNANTGIFSSNVGIGSATTPNSNLTITGNLWATTGINTATINVTTANVGTVVGTGALTLSTGTGSNGNIVFSANGTEYLRVTNTGNVGIGTTSPSSKLHIYGNNSTAVSSSTFWQFNFVGQEIININNTANTVSGLAFVGGLDRNAVSAIGGILESTSLNALGFFTGGSGVSGGSVPERMRITSGGNVGIGTTSPSTKFHVEGTGFFTSTLTSGSAATGATRISMSSNGDIQEYYAAETNPRWRIHRDLAASGVAAIGFNDTSGTIAATGCAVGTTSTGGTLGFYTSNGTALTERMRITSANVCIGTTTAISVYAHLHVRGSQKGVAIQNSDTGVYRAIYVSSDNLYFYNGTNEGYLNSSGAWTNASDERLKKDIVPIKYGLSTVLSTSPRSFKTKDKEVECIGFVAQEMLPIIPEVVSGNPERQYGLDYGSLVAVAFKAIQEQQAIIESLKSRIETLEAAS